MSSKVSPGKYELDVVTGELVPVASHPAWGSVRERLEAARRAFACLADLIEEHLYLIRNGCVETLCYVNHFRACNSMSFVEPHPGEPGGFAREFWQETGSRWFQPPRPIRAGDLIEFQGDAVSATGKRSYFRRYTLVTHVDAEYFIGVIIGSEDDPPSQASLAAAKRRYLSGQASGSERSVETGESR